MDDLFDGGARRRSKSKSKSRKSKSRSKSSRRSRSKTSKTKKTFTRVTRSGQDLGGEYTGTSPSDAARKAAKKSNKLPKKGTGEAEICVRQITRGRGHNKISCYKATQKMVPPTEHMIKKWGRKPSEKIRSVSLRKLKVK